MTTGHVRLESPRLIVRSGTEADVQRYLDYFTRNRAHLEPWEPAHDAEFYTEDYWRDRLRVYEGERETGTTERMCILEKGEAEFAGLISLTGIVARDPLWNARVGYSMDRDKQGRGIMSEAIALVIGHAWGTLNLRRLVAGHLPHNARSARVLARAGFVQEAYQREYLLVGGKWQDHVDTSLINTAWRAPEHA
jgi:ribosomal-protein-alanine N-acetyltransferase